MNNELIACCGLDCGECDARRATLLNDDGLREETARRWSVMNGTPEITSATIDCMGCRTEGVKFAYCSGMCSMQVCFGEGVRDLRRLSVDGMLPDGRGRFAARARCEDKPPFGRAPVRQGKGSYLNIQV